MEHHYGNIKLLIESIIDKIGRPISSQVVYATIESLGIREVDTICDYGYKSILDLAEVIYFIIVRDKNYLNSRNLKEKEFKINKHNKVQVSDYLWIKTKIFAEYYTLGIVNLLPVLIQLISIVFFGFSLWTFIGFNQVQSTSVVLGVISGLILSGGFVQVIGRQASFYWNHGDYEMTKKTINYLLIIGIKFILISIGILFLLNLIIPLYPISVLSILYIYAFLIGSLLLFLAPLHTIRKRWVITFSIFCGTITAVIVKELTTINTYFSHWLGIIVAIASCKILLAFYLKRLNKKESFVKKEEIKIPVILYHNYQYFGYGTFLYIFIFTDRILAWSTSKGHVLPFIVYFEKNYELGMDIAMLIFLLLSGVLEYSIASFTKFIDIGQKNTNCQVPHLFNGQLRKMYCQQITVLFITGAFAALLIYFIINASWGFESQFNEVLVQLSIKVCWLGCIGYILLAWGMLNSLYLFTLGQSLQPLTAIIYSCILNIVVGFLLSRFYAYEYSVVGLICGASLFVALTLKSNISFFKNLDYYYYAAF